MKNSILIIIFLILELLIIPSCGGGGGGGGSSVSPTINYGSVDGYVYAAVGSAPAARIALEAQPGYAPLVGASVRASQGNTSKTATTNSSGYFKIETLLAGSYVITISKTGYMNVQSSATVGANATTRLGGSGGTNVPPSSSGSIRVSANVAGGEVIIDAVETNVNIPANLNYTFSNISAGAHAVAIAKSGYETVAPVEVNVVAGATSNVSFVMNPTGNAPPNANAGEDAKWFVGNYYVYEGYAHDGYSLTNIYSQHQMYYQLDGSGSSDPNGNALTYRWTQISGPSVSLSAETANRTTFIPESESSYVFQLEVSDGYLTDTDTVTIATKKLEGKVVFSASNGPSSDIFSINLEDNTGSGLKRLTTGPEYDGGPRWSPDGNKIMFTTNPSRDEATYYIATMNANGTGVNVLGVEGGSRAWSPDGNKLLITSKYLGVYEFYEMNPDGSNLTRISITGKSKQTANYSPDGTQIVFAQELGYSNLEIYKINSDGTGLTKLTNNGKINLHPEWLPDGRILFTYNEDWAWGTDLFVMNSDGTGRQAWPTPVGVDNVIGPVMTDDGQFIFYTGDDYKIHVMYADGSAVLNLGVGASNIDYHPGP